jgi:hypothetical protein
VLRHRAVGITQGPGALREVARPKAIGALAAIVAMTMDGRDLSREEAMKVFHAIT